MGRPREQKPAETGVLSGCEGASLTGGTEAAEETGTALSTAAGEEAGSPPREETGVSDEAAEDTSGPDDSAEELSGSSPDASSDISAEETFSCCPPDGWYATSGSRSP